MVVSAIIMVVLRFMLAAENKLRDAVGTATADDGYDDVYITDLNDDGSKLEKHVDRVSFLRFCHSLNSCSSYRRSST